jgi:thiol:disulfide interchange protein
MAAFAQAHPEILQRRMKAFGDRLDALMKDVTLNVEHQFPNRWVTDPFAALADAKAHSRATFMVFSAAWFGASRDVDRSVSDPAVQKALDERFVAVRVDMTDDGALAVKKTSDTFKVTGLPVYLVFDKTGREVARKTELADAAGVLALLSQAK